MNSKLQGMLHGATLLTWNLIIIYFFLVAISSVNIVISSGGSIPNVWTHTLDFVKHSSRSNTTLL